MNDNDKTTDELIRDTHDMVSALVDTDKLPRRRPDKDSKNGKILMCLHQFRSPATTADVSQHTNIPHSTVASEITKLWQAYLLDRTDETPKTYRLTVRGENLIKEWEKQSTLDTHTLKSDSNTDQDPEPDPWDNTDLTRRRYQALNCVADFNGHPKSKDIDDKFCDVIGLEPERRNQYRITPYLTKLYRNGYVERPPSKPYSYWPTDKGKDALDK
jgi:predicted transcriptional regulator